MEEKFARWWSTTSRWPALGRQVLQEQADIELVGECSNGLETVTAIEQLSPDLVFSTCRCRKWTGSRSCGRSRGHVAGDRLRPAYKQYAVRAFEVHALDYLLKPFSSMRFRATLATRAISATAPRRRAGTQAARRWPRGSGKSRSAARGPNVSWWIGWTGAFRSHLRD